MQHGQPSPAETKGRAQQPRRAKSRASPGHGCGAHRRHLRTIPVETCLVKDCGQQGHRRRCRPMHADRLGDTDARRCRPVGQPHRRTHRLQRRLRFDGDPRVPPQPSPRSTGAPSATAPASERPSSTTTNPPPPTDGAATSTAWLGCYDHGVEVGGFDATVVSDIPGSSPSSSAAPRWRAAWRSLRLVVPPSPVNSPASGNRSRTDHRRSGNHGPAHLRRRGSGLGAFIDRRRSSCAGCAADPFVSSCSAPACRSLVDSSTRFAAAGESLPRSVSSAARCSLAVAEIAVDPIDRRRARHVVSENERPRTVDAVTATSPPGGLMDETNRCISTPRSRATARRSNSPRRDARRPHDRCRVCGAAIASSNPCRRGLRRNDDRALRGAVDQPSTELPVFHSLACRGARGTTLGVRITLRSRSRRAVSRYGVPVSPFVTGSTAEFCRRRNRRR